MPVKLRSTRGKATPADETFNMSTKSSTVNRLFLVAEYCAHDLYIGWHLYLRESKAYQRRNADGSWGWLRLSDGGPRGRLQSILDQVGIIISGDGTMDNDGVAEIARRFPLPGKKISGKPRGCIEIIEGDFGGWSLAGAL